MSIDSTVTRRMTMANDVSQEKKFVPSVLPWVLAGAALLVYLVSLNRWMRRGSVGNVAMVSGWIWQPELSRPLYWLVTAPLRLLPAEGAYVLTRRGAENAGAVDIGDGMCVVMKIESHNHPSAVEPYQGAATGVGGIVRDIFAMGARPIACLDSLRFGAPDAPRMKYLVDGVVAGIEVLYRLPRRHTLVWHYLRVESPVSPARRRRSRPRSGLPFGGF